MIFTVIMTYVCAGACMSGLRDTETKRAFFDAYPSISLHIGAFGYRKIVSGLFYEYAFLHC